MTTFVQSLLDRTPLGAIPRASQAIAAVLLDAAGLEPEHLMTGIHVIDVSDSAQLSEAVEAVLLDTLGRATFVDTTAFRRKPGPDHVVCVNSSDLVEPSSWLPTAIDIGATVVHVFGTGSLSLPMDFGVLVTRTSSLPEVDAPGVIPATVEIVTGERLDPPEVDYKGCDFEDILKCVQRGSTAARAFALLKTMSERRSRSVVDEFIEAGKRTSEFEALKAPAGRVIRKLSEMTGFGEAGVWGMRLAQDIRDYRERRLDWEDLDKGMLISGPPGGGKSTFARALALECDCELIVSNYDDWTSAGGSGDALTRGLKKSFKDWRKKGVEEGPVIVFIDEIDSIGRRGGNAHNESWFTAIINSWLAFLDGAEPREGVIVIAATNHPDRVDPALLRPGRLDRHVVLPMPGIQELSGIIRHHLGPHAHVIDAHLAQAARACRGRSPAEIEQICREARRMARQVGAPVSAGHVLNVLAFRRLETARPDAEDWLTAVHEAGHALSAIILDLPLEWVDLDAGSTKLGDMRLLSLDAVHREIAMGLAGRAAEEVVLGSVSIGCQDDLRVVTARAMQLHTRFGMGLCGLVSMEPGSLSTDDELFLATRGTLDECYARALKLVTQRKDSVVRTAEALVERRYLDGAEVHALYRSPLRRLLRPAEETDEGYRVAS